MDDFKGKVAFIVETDGLLKDYLESVVINEIKSRMTDDTFKSLNTHHIHTALILKSIAPCSLKNSRLPCGYRRRQPPPWRIAWSRPR